MRFVKLEGDALFCFADGAVFQDGERFIELIEVSYFDFSNRLLNMARHTTCRCAACAAIDSLDLKFLAHYGSFVLQGDAGRKDLAGPDVILVHRRLKNTISDRHGAQAYAFFTNACMQRLPSALDLPAHDELDDSFGRISEAVHDLKPTLAAMREAHREYISSEEADFVSNLDVPVPPVAAWKYWVDPNERQRWACRQFSKSPDRVTRNAGGRIGTGAAMHCNHGPGTWHWEFVDWRPFAYFTSRITVPLLGRFIGPRPELDTVEFVPTEEGGTRIVHRIRLTDRGRMSLLTYRIQRRVIAAFWRRANAELLSIIGEDITAPRPREP
jgi:hypothetical protein